MRRSAAKQIMCPTRQGYGLAVVMLLAASGLSLFLWPITKQLPSVLFFIAIAITARFGGLGPCLLVAVASAAFIDYFFQPPLYTIDLDLSEIVLIAAFLLIAVLISTLNASFRSASQQEAQLAAIVESSDDVIIGKTLEGIVTSWNPAAERLYGYTAEEMIGRPISKLAPPEHPDEIPRLLARLRRGERIDHSETTRVCKDGARVEVSLSISPVRDSTGQIVGAAAIARDITERRRMEAEREELLRELAAANIRLEELAATDVLTQLPNRRTFETRLAKEWRRAARMSMPLSLLFLDVDAFKNYNDAYGHPAGDECLRAIAQALRDTVQRSGDLAMRYGGEEFVVILPDTDSRGAEVVSERLCAGIGALRLPHQSSPVADHVTLSVGGATIVPSRDTSSDSLVAAADRALYQAKRTGRNRTKVVAL